MRIVVLCGLGSLSRACHQRSRGSANVKQNYSPAGNRPMDITTLARASGPVMLFCDRMVRCDLLMPQGRTHEAKIGKECGRTGIKTLACREHRVL
jgi:hypothetical protein